MHDQADLAQGWVRKADSDLATTELLAKSQGPFDTACFHTQQAVEKYLKAILALHGEPIPRTHDLEVVLNQCLKF